MATGKAFSTRECYFYVVPAGIFLFSTGLPYLPYEGVLIDYLDAQTSVTTRYRIQDVILEVVEESPGSPHPDVHVPRWRIEIQVAP